MKQFWKDYGELCKESCRFYKKHWKGVVVLNAVLIGAELAYFNYKANQLVIPMGNLNKEDETQ